MQRSHLTLIRKSAPPTVYANWNLKQLTTSFVAPRKYLGHVYLTGYAPFNCLNLLHFQLPVYDRDPSLHLNQTTNSKLVSQDKPTQKTQPTTSKALSQDLRLAKSPSNKNAKGTIYSGWQFSNCDKQWPTNRAVIILCINANKVF